MYPTIAKLTQEAGVIRRDFLPVSSDSQPDASSKQRQRKAIVVVCISLLCLAILGLLLFKLLEVIQTSDGTLKLYCPTGKTFPAVEGEAMRGYEDHCQCQDGALCWFHTDHVHLGCSGGLFGAYYGYQANAKAACIIHDICYETERNQTDCDREFKHNILQLCGDREDCDYYAKSMHWGVKEWGKPFMEQRTNCSGSYTSSCAPHLRGTFDRGVSCTLDGLRASSCGECPVGGPGDCQSEDCQESQGWFASNCQKRSGDI